VSPDIILPDKDLFNYSTQIGESNLDNPLAWDTIQPAAYDKMNLVAPYLADLRELSDARVLTNQDFSYVRQDIEQFKKLQVDRTTSLNEHQIIKDRERDAAKNHMREEERDKRPDPGIRVYELTVENAAEPGLPPPENWLGMTNDPAVAVAIKNIASELDHTPAVPAPGAKVTGIESNTATQAKKPSPPFDPMLDESERILEDYISLMQKRGNLTSIP